MTQTSSYLQYLPPFLASEEEADPRFFLGQFLLVFEKMLTGLPDGVPIQAAVDKKPAVSQPIEPVIDGLYHTFNPWRTRAPALRWLASWVGLTLRGDWSEYQQRKIIADAVSIYQQRWLKRGLYTYLDIYATTPQRPRIAIDDGEALSRVTLRAAGGLPRLETIAFSGLLPEEPLSSPAQPDTTRRATPFLLHPVALTLEGTGPDLRVVIVDAGPDLLDPARRQPAIWRLSATGEPLDWQVPSSASGPRPRPLNAPDFLPDAPGAPARSKLLNPVAVAADGQGRYVVVDQGPQMPDEAKAVLYRYAPDAASGGFVRQTLLDGAALGGRYPVDMLRDSAGRFVILDRGSLPTLDAASPKLILVTIDAESPLHVTARSVPISGLVEPMAFVRESDTSYVVVDARTQRIEATDGPVTDDDRKKLAGDLVRLTFNPSTPPANIAGQSLLGTVAPAQNLLIYPTGLVLEKPDVFLVCDRGYKAGFLGDDSSNRVMAEPARLVRVDLTGIAPVFTDVIPGPGMVWPSRLAMGADGTLMLADRGESRNDGTTGRDWRLQPHEFGVVVYFSAERPTEPADRTRILNGIAAVIEEQRPAHAPWSLQF